jgi:hypothetical protein
LKLGAVVVAADEETLVVTFTLEAVAVVVVITIDG